MRVSDFVGAVEALGRSVAYFPGLRKACGSVAATILACQLIYWSDKGAAGDGWVYKESSDITEETGLSYEEQRTARRHLAEAGLLEERYDRLNHRMFFRLNRSRFNALMDSPSEDCPVPEMGIAQFGNQGLPSSLIESEITSETTTRVAVSQKTLSLAERGSGQQTPAARAVSETDDVMRGLIESGRADASWGFAALAAGQQVTLAQPTQAQRLENDIENACLFLSEDVRPLAKAFMGATGCVLDRAHRARDTKTLREMRRHGVTPDILTDTVAVMRRQGLTIAAPHSVMSIAIAQVAKRRLQQAQEDAPQQQPTRLVDRSQIEAARNVIRKQ